MTYVIIATIVILATLTLSGQSLWVSAGFTGNELTRQTWRGLFFGTNVAWAMVIVAIAHVGGLMPILPMIIIGVFGMAAPALYLDDRSVDQNGRGARNLFVTDAFLKGIGIAFILLLVVLKVVTNQ